MLNVASVSYPPRQHRFRAADTYVAGVFLVACGEKSTTIGGEDHTVETSKVERNSGSALNEASERIVAVDFRSHANQRLAVDDRVRILGRRLVGEKLNATVRDDGIDPETRWQLNAPSERPVLRIAHDPETDELLARRRAESEFPNANVHPLGLAYPVGTPADRSMGRAVEPHEVFVVFPPLGDGTGSGRGRMIAYSVTNAGDGPVRLDTHLEDDQGDPRR